MKSNGVEQRKIFIICPFNTIVLAVLLATGQAYEYGMQVGAALGQVDAPSGKLHVSSVDQSHVFTHVLASDLPVFNRLQPCSNLLVPFVGSHFD